MESLRQLAQDLYRCGLEAVDPYYLVEQQVTVSRNELRIGRQIFRLDQISGIQVVGIGKSCLPMAQAIVDLLGDRLAGGLLVTHAGFAAKAKLPPFQVMAGAHPHPDQSSLEAGRAVLDLVDRVGEDELVLFLISGGGSAMVEQLVPQVRFEQYQELMKYLIFNDFDITEINRIRASVSQIKGGRLSQRVVRDRQMSLILSDIVSADQEEAMGLVASGPTVWQGNPVIEAFEIFQNRLRQETQFAWYGDYLQAQIKLSPSETTPAPGVLIGSNHDFIQGISRAAQDCGWRVLIDPTPLGGLTTTAAKQYAQAFLSHCDRRKPSEKYRLCFIKPAECTVNLKGEGLGGRCQELATAIMGELMLNNGFKPSAKEKICILCASSDGQDGPTDAAGGIISVDSLFQMQELELDPFQYVEENDSYNFLKQTDSLLKTGLSFTNVADVVIGLIQ